MKKLYTVILAATLALAAAAQTTPTKMKINYKSGFSETISLSTIDNITFVGEDPTPVAPGVNGTFEIEVPAADSFTESLVYKVMNEENVQVAEICYEYINTVNERRIVIYPCSALGATDLTRGFVTDDGGSIAWDKSANTCTYTAGTDAVPVLYYENGNLVLEPVSDEHESTILQPYTLEDKRGLLETNIYPIVKIGTQYWMAENLRAKYLNDGTSIPMYKGTQVVEWKALTSPAWHVIYDDVDDEYGIFTEYGCMYNGYAVKDDKIAPKGWAVTSADDWTVLKTYLGTGGGGKVRSTSPAVWNDGVSASNLSGLNIPGGGYFNPAGDGDDRLGEQVYYWTTSIGTDLFGGESDSYLRCMLMSKTSAINITGNHTFEFGHYIRCIRK